MWAVRHLSEAFCCTPTPGWAGPGQIPSSSGQVVRHGGVTRPWGHKGPADPSFPAVLHHRSPQSGHAHQVNHGLPLSGAAGVYPPSVRVCRSFAVGPFMGPGAGL